MRKKTIVSNVGNNKTNYHSLNAWEINPLKSLQRVINGQINNQFAQQNLVKLCIYGKSTSQ